MSRLVTGLYYSRSEAERAVQALIDQGISSENIYLEAEIAPTPDVGRKGGEVSQLERERRFAGLETGLVIGVIVGFMAGMAVGMLGNAMHEMIRSVSSEPNVALPAAVANPVVSAILGAIMGLIAGGIVGWMVDFTLSRMGAGPPLPAQETLVTVRTGEDQVDQVSAALFRARARHLHVAEAAVP